MIAVRPDNTAGRALRLIGDLPGEVDAETLGRHLWPLPPMPTASWSAYLEWRASVAVVKPRPDVVIERQKGDWLPPAVRPGRLVTVVGPERTARASRLLSRLQERGLVGTAGAPVLAGWAAERASRLGWPRTLAVALHCAIGEVPPAVLRLVLCMVENPPGSVADLLGARPSGHKQRAYGRACDIGVIVPPSRRSLTDAGSALVASWSTP